MAKKMLIDATHEEETRVAVVDGNRLAEFDYESKVRKLLKGSIFLAKVTRVEPSLQAAFVNFGGNRHGFLPFSEIHPDYYRIPIADRERLLAEEAARSKAMQAEEYEEYEEDKNAPSDHEEEDDDEDVLEEVGGNMDGVPKDSNADETDEPDSEPRKAGRRPSKKAKTTEEPIVEEEITEEETEEDNIGNRIEPEEEEIDEAIGNREGGNETEIDQSSRQNRGGRDRYRNNRGGRNNPRGGRSNSRGRMPHRSRRVEVVGGDIEGEQPRRPNLRRQYKIQEVVKRGQIMLIQVSKEERGNKGAAVTTYLSLPGRYCVLMPNSAHGGGVSRKIASFSDRRKMKDMLTSLKVPEGMSVILRTAGVERTKAEIKRDLDYLTRLWDNIRELTLKSTAPALINEEGNLIKRAIRDLYTRDIDEVIVSGGEAYKSAKNFMKMLIPSHAKKVQEYKDDNLPLFTRYQVENQINEIGEPSVTLRSGGTLVINPTEALVSIDVNSGRATKERHIEETAVKTNLEAADEVARQLRLRDLGGLVVIDFIDMEDRRNNARVERRLKEALSSDRARIQIGRISSFGLLELSRQRMNPSLTESQFKQCPHCAGVGYIRTLDGTAIAALRAIEEIGTQRNHSEVILIVPNEIALYILNNKRAMLAAIEERYGFKVFIRSDEVTAPDKFLVEPGALKRDDEENVPAETVQVTSPPEDTEESKDDEQPGGKGTSRRRGRRGGRRRRREERTPDHEQENAAMDSGQTADKDEASTPEPQAEAPADESGAEAQPSGDNPPKSPRSSSPRRRKPKTARSDSAADKEAPSEAIEASPAKAEQAEEKTASTAKPARNRRKKTETPDTSPAAAPEQKNEKPAPAAPPAVKEPKASKEYEIISEVSSRKKKGWWNKLIE